MQTINLAIYSSSTNDCEIIDKIIDFFKKEYEIVNIHLFTDGDNSCQSKKYASLPSFYMTFYKDAIVFLNIDDYIDNYNEILSEIIYVIASKDEIKNYYVDTKNTKKIHLLAIENETINEIR